MKTQRSSSPSKLNWPTPWNMKPCCEAAGCAVSYAACGAQCGARDDAMGVMHDYVVHRVDLRAEVEVVLPIFVAEAYLPIEYVADVLVVYRAARARAVAAAVAEARGWRAGRRHRWRRTSMRSSRTCTRRMPSRAAGAVARP